MTAFVDRRTFVSLVDLSSWLMGQGVGVPVLKALDELRVRVEEQAEKEAEAASE